MKEYFIFYRQILVVNFVKMIAEGIQIHNPCLPPFFFQPLSQFYNSFKSFHTLIHLKSIVTSVGV